MDWVSYDVLLSRSTFSTQILLLWHTEMVTTQYGTVSLFGICGGFLVGTKIPCFDRRLKIEQSHHHFPRHWKLRHLPLEPMYQEADHRRTTRCCTYHPQVPIRRAFLMLIYLFLVCICPHFGGKCRTVDMACQFCLARRKSTSIQTLEFIQEIFLLNREHYCKSKRHKHNHHSPLPFTNLHSHIVDGYRDQCKEYKEVHQPHIRWRSDGRTPVRVTPGLPCIHWLCLPLWGKERNDRLQNLKKQGHTASLCQSWIGQERYRQRPQITPGMHSF